MQSDQVRLPLVLLVLTLAEVMLVEGLSVHMAGEDVNVEPAPQTKPSCRSNWKAFGRLEASSAVLVVPVYAYNTKPAGKRVMEKSPCPATELLAIAVHSSR